MSGYRHRQQIRIGVLMTQVLLDRLEKFAAKSKLSMTDICRQALVAFLDGAE